MNRNKKKLKHQFLLIVLLSSIPFFITTNIIILNITITAGRELQSRMENTTIILHNTFDALLRTNIKTYLQAKVETGTDLIYRLTTDPDLSGQALEERKEHAAAELLSLRVGKTGYFYAIDSDGIVIFHPDQNIVNSDFHNESPANIQLVQKEGYLEYDWQNTFETQSKKKALYMTYIPEFDWILTATSYRDEFTDMIDRDSIKNSVTEIRFGESGYSYVVDRNEGIIAHPLFEPDSIDSTLAENDFKKIIEKLFLKEEGFTTYQWKNKSDSRFREKIVYSKYIEDFDWIIGTAMIIGEENNYITSMFFINVLIVLSLAVLLFIIVRRVSVSIEYPISDIYRTMELAIGGDLSVRTHPGGPDEIKTLGDNLNNFIATLESRTRFLEATIEEKDFLLREIQHRIKNNLQTIISLLNIQTDFTDNEETQTSLLSTRNRVSVMALVYDQMLLSDSDFHRDELALPAFLTNYTNSILTSVKFDYSRLNLSSDYDEVFLRRNTAISLGLILNELLSHSINNLPSDNSEIKIDISLKQLDDLDLLFTIEDNRCSFGMEKWNREDNKIAFMLVDVLSQQLSGSTVIAHHDDTCQYQIKFPIKA